MADNKRMQFMIEDAQIVFRNFEGKEGMYNKAGDRNFAVILDEPTAKQMADDGWNVKQLRGDDDAPGDFYIEIAVNFKNKPPKIVTITSTARNTLNADTVEMLDYADIQTVDLIAVAFHWEVNGKTGIKAYLKSMFVTLEEDELERKYAVGQG